MIEPSLHTLYGIQSSVYLIIKYIVIIIKTRSHAGNRTRVLWVKATDASPYTTWEMTSTEIEQLYIYSVDTLRMCKLARHYMNIFKENVTVL